MSKEVYILELRNLTKVFSDDFGVKNKVLEDISFTIPADSPKVTSILASFGGGKSTLLKLIAGIEKPDSGEVVLNGGKYLQPDGKIVLIPEKSASLPWLNVVKNIELASGLETCGKNDRHYEINDLITLVGLNGYENHYPHNDSFGFRFRISLARALMFNPIVLLLDDCFKKMDQTAREEIYTLIYEISKKTDTYFLIATTNVSEAVRLSGRVLMMSKGPARIYNDIIISEDLISDYKSSMFIDYRRKIEDAFNKENQPGIINFSI
jgi:NitT/TauT family transport system ATP-binding protein